MNKTLVLTHVGLGYHVKTFITYRADTRDCLQGQSLRRIVTQPLLPVAPTPDNPRVIHGPVRTDKGPDGHHSGEWQGGGETAVVSGWAVGWLPEICASLVGGGWTAGHGAALISAFWSRTKAWAGGEAAVQGNALQSRRAHTPKSWGRWPLSLALRASVVSLSVALKGAGHTTSPRHLVVCLGSWAPWRLLGRQALEHTFPITLRLSLHPRTGPQERPGAPLSS